jgi:hypothetical protein
METGPAPYVYQPPALTQSRTGDSSHGNGPAGVRERRILEALGAH